MTREIWTGLSGGAVSQFTSSPRYWQPANQVTTFSGAATPSNVGDSYASRVRGYITAPVTGDYTFWIAADDSAELWLSSDASKFTREKIAFLTSWVGSQAWDAKPTQKSALIHLEAGQRYFVEALHKEASGGDHLAIAWQTPGGVRELISATALESFTADPDDADNDDLSDAWEAAHGFDLADNGTLYPDQHPLADPDQDGYTNYEESRYGTDPFERAGLKGFLSLDTWLGIPGAQLATHFLNPKAGQAPDWAEFVGSAQPPVNRADSYTARLRGHLLPPVTGSYTFYIAGDDEIELWLSSGESQFAKQKIAFNSTWTKAREWTKSATQKSTPITLKAGKKYYLEAWLKEDGGGDNLAVGWQKPGSTAIEVIPGSALASHVRDSADADGDDLPDAWEIQHGLDPVVNEASADPDHDLIPNLFEYKLGTDPQVANGYSGAWTQEIWWDLPGKMLTDFTESPRFLDPADSRSLVASSDFGCSAGDAYGRRVRGYLTAPTTGDYTFWIASDDYSQLWLSSGEAKRDRQLIANVEGWVPRYAWDTAPSQKSVTVHLTAGSRYYMEALHKDGGNDDHLAIAWQTPGGTREIIPAAAITPFFPTADDQDDDDLPDAWELANGLDPADNGRIDPKNGPSGDADGDGLANLAEWKAGTRANLADTDGDGMSDWEEITLAGTQALVADAAAFESVATLQGSAYAAASPAWTQDAANARQTDVRGWLDYPVALTAAGLYQLDLTFTPIADAGVSKDYEWVFSANGKEFQRVTVSAEAAASGHAKVLTPWLPAGANTIRVYLDNSHYFRRVRVESLQVLAARGTDANANGSPDWVDLRLAAQNTLEVPTSSPVSPVCLEGKARWPQLTTVNGLVVKAAPDDRWYLDLPLSADEPTPLAASLENGAVTAQREIAWTKTNLLTAAEPFLLRVGDALKLAAFQNPGDATGGTATLTVEGNTYALTGDQARVHRFDQAGTIPVTVSHTAADGATTQRTLQVTVVAAPVMESPICVMGQYRDVDIPALPDGVVHQLDSRLEIQGTTTDGTGAEHHVLRTNTLSDRTATFRLGGSTGPILATVPYRAMRVRSAGDTTVLIQENVGNDTYKVMMPVIVNGLHPDAAVKFDIFISGVFFDDGSRSKTLQYPDTLSAEGEATLNFLKASTVGSNCHRTSVWQGEKRIAYFQ